MSTDTRTEPDLCGTETDTLTGYLRYHRETLEWKCQGLDAEAMARRAIEPSSLSLLGLVRHLADVERYWFRVVLAGVDAEPLFWSEAEPDGEFHGAHADPELVTQAWTAWRDEIAFADDFVANHPDLDVTGDGGRRGPISLRWVLVHLVEEYARHNGHADLLRERIDGTVGD